MPVIRAATTGLPPHRVTQEMAKQFARDIFSNSFPDIERLLPLFDNAGVETRYISQPISWYRQEHSFSEKNRLFVERAIDLCVETINKLLEAEKLAATDIDYIIFVNSTGLATPSIDAHLINRLKMKKQIRRTPIWGLGCAGGAAGLAHAYHHALGHPGDRVLLVAVELCGLTFLADDYSKSNLVASALFGDGAAAVLIEGDKVNSTDRSQPSLKIIGSRSTLYPDSLDVMGWHVVDKGLQVLFAQRIPDIVEKHVAGDLTAFLVEHELSLGDISHFLIHPGGTKVLNAYKVALGLDDKAMALCRDVMKNYGNMSSVTVLFVLEQFLAGNSTAGEYAILSALGPGFCSESLLLCAS